MGGGGDLRQGRQEKTSRAKSRQDKKKQDKVDKTDMTKQEGDMWVGREKENAICDMRYERGDRK